MYQGRIVSFPVKTERAKTIQHVLLLHDLPEDRWIKITVYPTRSSALQFSHADGHEKDWLLVTTAPHSTAAAVRDYYALRTDIEELHRQVKCFWDLTRFPSTAWNVIVSQTVLVALTYSLLQLHLLHHGHQELNRRSVEISCRLLPDGDRVIIYRQRRFAFFTLLEHTELALSLTEQARRKALANARRLMNEDGLA